uniref:Pancreatic trypsin inhibitor n=1 Tax=Rhipicephalus zambeziensis TaxID=60191 RepID=A0A224YD02_9ACAR
MNYPYKYRKCRCVADVSTLNYFPSGIAMCAAYMLISCLFSSVVFQQCSASANSTADACLETPTVEGCTIIRRMWSFSSRSGQCQLNFVCSNHTNAFRDEATCNEVCSSVPRPQPPESFQDCAFWLTQLHKCQQKWLKYYLDYWGKVQQVLIYTGCGSSPHKHYAYYVSRRHCTELNLPRGRTRE